MGVFFANGIVHIAYALDFFSSCNTTSSLGIAEEIGFLCDLAPPAVFERHVAVINRNPRSVTVCRR